MTFTVDLSFQFLGASQLAAAAAAGLALLSAVGHFVAREGSTLERLSRYVSGTSLCVFIAGLASSLAGLVLRGIEVNHFPVQTMFEALTTTATALFLSFGVLYLVLGLYRSRGVVRGVSDLFLAIVMAGEFFLIAYANTQEKGPRTLPPALQSYWMAPHVSALLLSYVTLSIAYVAALLYFTLKLIRQLAGGPGLAKPMTLPAIACFLGFVFLPPFAQVVNIAIFVPVAGLALVLARRGKLAGLDSWIGGFDKFSFAIFSVGFPFLTAGLMMGGFWAQEAWALYWGWDSKETSALISWLVYVVYVHLRLVAGWRGERGLWVIFAGAISILVTYQLFGYLPASQDSLHKYTDGISREGTELSGAPAAPIEAR